MRFLSLRKMSAIFLTAALAAGTAFTLSACHQKDEVALTVNGTNIPSGIYMFYVIQAEQTARNTVDSNNASADVSSTASVNYQAQTVSGESFDNWANAQALESACEYAIVEQEFTADGLSLSSDDTSQIDTTVDEMWNGYTDSSTGMQYSGESATYTQNGVSKDTFTTCYTNAYKRNMLFDHIYGSGGTQAVSQSDLLTAMDQDYVLADVLEVDFSTYDPSTGSTTALSDADKSTKLALLQDCETALQNGMSFSDVQTSFNNNQSPLTGASMDSSTTSTDSSTTSTDSSATSTDSSAASTASDSTDVSAPSVSSTAINPTDSTAYQLAHPLQALADPDSSAVTDDTTSTTPAISATDDSSAIVSDDSGTSSGDTVASPLDPNAQVFGSSATSNPFTYFDQIHAMSPGDINLFSNLSDMYLLVVREDITQDPYYIQPGVLGNTVLHAMKDSEFNTSISDAVQKATIVQNHFVMDNYTPNKVNHNTSAAS